MSKFSNIENKTSLLYKTDKTITSIGIPLLAIIIWRSLSSSSSFILGSDTLLSSTTDAMFIIKFDSTGNVICISSLASGGDDWSGVATDGAGNAYIAGDSEVNPFVVGTDTLSVQSSAEYFFITKYRCPTTLAISEIPNPESLTLYPNPATTSFTIESTNKIQSIKVINVIGEDIITNYELGITNAVSIDVSGIAKGIYFVQITVDSAGSPTKKVVNKKIVVQ